MLRGATGHADFITDWQAQGFTWKNVMWSRWESTQAGALDHFTLGQVYRMNVHGGSWLNESGLRGAATDITKACSSDPSDQNPCPRLGLDVGGSGK